MKNGLSQDQLSHTISIEGGNLVEYQPGWQVTCQWPCTGIRPNFIIYPKHAGDIIHVIYLLSTITSGGNSS